MSCKPERHEWKINDEESHPVDGATCLCGAIKFRESDRWYMNIADVAELRARADRDARFVAAAREAVAWGIEHRIRVTPADVVRAITHAHREIYDRPCEPVKEP